MDSILFLSRCEEIRNEVALYTMNKVEMIYPVEIPRNYSYHFYYLRLENNKYILEISGLRRN